MMIRKLIGVSALVAGTIVVTSAFRQQASAGEVGDVVYSILSPVQFRALHGNGWVQMDGRNINGSTLCSDQGVCTLPDARGVFIRGMNLGRPSESGDASGDRPLGSYQSDAIKTHQHNYREWRWQVHSGSGPYGDGLTANAGNKPEIATTAGPESPETRPRNITLYTYIKISK